MNYRCLTFILVHYPVVVLIAVGVFSGTCIIIPLTLSVPWPSFKDPELGFSTRGTEIADRLITWTNLVKSTGTYGEFTRNPKEVKELLKSRTQTYNNLSRAKSTLKPRQKKIKKPPKSKGKPVYGSVTFNEDKNSSTALAELNRWKSVQHLEPNNQKNFEENFFCGNPDERYAHLVISTYNTRDLFNLADLLSLCRLEHQLIGIQPYEDLCIQNAWKKCCKPWSLPNFVAFFNRKASCLAITAEDVENTKNLLMQCSRYFHSNELNSQCFSNVPYNCGCLHHDAVFNVLNYITSTSFLPANETVNAHSVNEVMIFLPLACSTAIIPYYNNLSSVTLDYDGLKIVAINFGIKSSVFDMYLIRDTYLMGSGVCFVFLCIWVYTRSLFLTLVTIIIILCSLAIAYFVYSIVFEIRFFPFMNLLATIVAIGIGSDDAFIFCKSWEMQKLDQEAALEQIMTKTLQHASASLFISALTTAVAFLGSYVCAVTAVACFSIFAGTTVIINYLLMMTVFPACLVIWERSCMSNQACFKSCTMTLYHRWCCIKLRLNLSDGWCKYFNLNKIFKANENWILSYIIRYKYFWCILMGTLSVASGFVVFVYPKMQLPDSQEFQLFESSHLFEQYDFKYKNQFWFNRPEKDDQVNYKLPLRFVWGVLPIDNGNPLDPTRLGTLTLDPDFDMSDPESQEWLLNFCQSVRQQPFYHSMIGPLLPNCFVETFMNSMNRKCYDAFLNMDRTPCCEISKFPFNRTVFNECIENEIEDIFSTPTNLLNPGMGGPKFSKDQNATIKVVVIEYDSAYSYTMSYEEMDSFFNAVESWMIAQLKTAPESLKNGWFVSDLAFYDLQRELNVSIEIAVVISMGLALVVLFLSTRNVLTSLFAIITIISIIVVTIAVLVLSGWKLNVLEATAISSAIGLTVDFSLHYTVNYRMCPENVAINREAATKYALDYMAGPAFMAAITTGAAGAFMLPSLILPYIQIGMFLLIVMCVNWIYSTFMLGSMLAIGGPSKDCCQFNWFNRTSLFGRPQPVQERPLPPPFTLANADSHELESLTFSKEQTNSPRPLRRSLSVGGVRFTPKYTLTDQSPSATSAITIILTDDN